MSDYKELLKNLRGLCSVKDYEQCEYNLQAADAIEELLADNESYKCAFADLHIEISNYCEKIATLEKERDEAMKEVSLYHYCRSCKHSNVSGEKEPCLSCNQCWAGKEKCNWEWKGVQDE